MSRHGERLAQRRRELGERAAAQRAAVERAIGPLLVKAAAVDRVIAFVRSRQLFELAGRAITLYLLLKR